MKQIIITLLLLLPLSIAGENIHIEVGSTRWKPYIYEENGVIKGYIFEMAEAILKECGYNYDCSLDPWPRVYYNGLNKENYLILGLSRTPKREDLFHWIGRGTIGEDVHLISKKGTILPHSIDDATIGVTKDSVSQDILIQMGHRWIHPHSDKNQLLILLNNERIDYHLSAVESFKDLVSLAGGSMNNYEIGPIVYEEVNYIAASKKTPLAIVNRLKKGYSDLLEKGLIEPR